MYLVPQCEQCLPGLISSCLLMHFFNRLKHQSGENFVSKRHEGYRDFCPRQHTYHSFPCSYSDQHNCYTFKHLNLTHSVHSPFPALSSSPNSIQPLPPQPHFSHQRPIHSPTKTRTGQTTLSPPITRRQMCSEVVAKRYQSTNHRQDDPSGTLLTYKSTF